VQFFYLKMHQKLLGAGLCPDPLGILADLQFVPSDLAARTLWGRGLVMCR